MPSFFPPGIKLLKCESQIERVATLMANPFLAGSGLLHDVSCDGTTQYKNIHFNRVKKSPNNTSLSFNLHKYLFLKLLNNSGFAMQTERDLLYKSSPLCAIFGTLRELWVLSV